MATAVITLTDNDDTGSIQCTLNFDPSFSADSISQVIAMGIVSAIREGRITEIVPEVTHSDAPE